jgi:hypothetical protein
MTIPATIAFGASGIHGQEVPVAPAMEEEVAVPLWNAVQPAKLKCSDIKIEDIYVDGWTKTPYKDATDLLQKECAKSGCNADNSTIVYIPGTGAYGGKDVIRRRDNIRGTTLYLASCK